MRSALANEVRMVEMSMLEIKLIANMIRKQCMRILRNTFEFIFCLGLFMSSQAIAMDSKVVRETKRKINVENGDQAARKRIKRDQQKEVVEREIEIKDATAFFGSLADDQEAYELVDLRTKAGSLDDTYWERHFAMREMYKGSLRPFKHFMDLFHGANREQSAKLLGEIFVRLNADVEQFISYLMENNFALHKLDHFDRIESDSSIPKIVDRYVNLMRLMFLENDPTSGDDEDFVATNKYLFTVANKFFDYCFRGANKKFEVRLKSPECYPVLRLMYSVMLECFVRTGWKDWSIECLLDLAKEAKQGKRVYYLAGGCDIFTLLDEGVYNITVIDPFFPTQEEFYSTGWQWFVRNQSAQDNGIGDILEFPEQKLRLTRTHYSEQGSFLATMSNGEKVNLPLSKTVWQVFDLEEGMQLGTVELERRFCAESDFSPIDDGVQLMSFNELYFVSTVSKNGGWRLEHKKMAPNLSLYVKQLHKPIGKECIVNMRKSEYSNFKFCCLGAQAS